MCWAVTWKQPDHGPCLTWPCHPYGIMDCQLHSMIAAMRQSETEAWAARLTMTRQAEHIFRLSRGQGLTPDGQVPREKVQGDCGPSRANVC